MPELWLIFLIDPPLAPLHFLQDGEPAREIMKKLKILRWRKNIVVQSRWTKRKQFTIFLKKFTSLQSKKKNERKKRNKEFFFRKILNKSQLEFASWTFSVVSSEFRVFKHYLHKNEHRSINSAKKRMWTCCEPFSLLPRKLFSVIWE